MYEKVSPMNGIPSPVGGKGNELHTTTASKIRQRAAAQQFAPNACCHERYRKMDCALPFCITTLDKQFIQNDCNGDSEKHCSCTLQ